jgi:sedoheptulokinase
MQKTESASTPNSTWIPSANHWEKTQDPARIIALVKQSLNGLLAVHGEVKGIGVTGQMHGILYIDEQGNAVSPLYTWQDARGNEIYRDNKTYAGYLSELTGYPLATGYGLVTHFYNSVNNLVPANARRICTIMDYAVMKLTGLKAPLTDYSNGASLGFFDVERLAFDVQALEKAGIDVSFLPRLTNTDASCGDFNSIPVFPAIGDNQAAFMGSVQNVEQSVHITVGTSSQISVFSEKYIKLPGLDTRPFPGGGYILVGAALCGGSAFALLKSFFEQTLLFLGISEWDEDEIYRAMTSVAYQPDDLLKVSTLFDGTRRDPSLKGAITGLSRANFTPQNLTVGFLQGIAQELHDFYQTIPDSIKSGKKALVGSGNGFKKNALLRRVFEDIFNLDIKISYHDEEAALGACLISLKKQEDC